MFGIDFSEILVIFGIALVVLGPERLPKLAATIGRWLGRARSMARQFREQLEHEATRLQTEAKVVQDSAKVVQDSAKGVHDSLDLNAATQPQGSTEPPAASPAATTSEFGLHNAGAPEAPASSGTHPTDAAPAREERAVEVEAHER
jgi:sec-independent protein translocase protein TatB